MPDSDLPVSLCFELITMENPSHALMHFSITSCDFSLSTASYVDPFEPNLYSIMISNQFILLFN